jgi:transcriptional regulator with XRE-family HTH domain
MRSTGASFVNPVWPNRWSSRWTTGGLPDTIVSVTQLYDHPSTASALLQLARIKSGLSQAQLAQRAGVPATMISAYERDRRQPTLPTLLRLLQAAGFDLRMELVPHDPHDEILEELESKRTRRERAQRDRQQAAWRRAVPVADHQPVQS